MCPHSPVAESATCCLLHSFSRDWKPCQFVAAPGRGVAVKRMSRPCLCPCPTKTTLNSRSFLGLPEIPGIFLPALDACFKSLILMDLQDAATGVARHHSYSFPIVPLTNPELSIRFVSNLTERSVAGGNNRLLFLPLGSRPCDARPLAVASLEPFFMRLSHLLRSIGGHGGK